MLGRWDPDPALSAADGELPSSDGAWPLREIADITISADNLEELVTLRQNFHGADEANPVQYRFVIGFNGSLIGLGTAGVFGTGHLCHAAQSFYSGRKPAA